MNRIFFELSYFRKPRWDTGISPPELMEFIATHPAGRALDLGCGTGTNVVTLAQHGWQVGGVDFVSRAILRARTNVSRAGLKVDLQVGDVTQLDKFPGPYDLILDIGCFHSLSKAKRFNYLHEVKSRLASGGTLMLYVHLRSLSPASSVPGFSEDDLPAFSPELELLRRADSWDRPDVKASWLWFIKGG